MPGHDEYGKRVLRAAAGEAVAYYGPSVEIDYGAGQPARIDGTVSHMPCACSAAPSVSAMGGHNPNVHGQQGLGWLSVR